MLRYLIIVKLNEGSGSVLILSDSPPSHNIKNRLNVDAHERPIAGRGDKDELR